MWPCTQSVSNRAPHFPCSLHPHSHSRESESGHVSLLLLTLGFYFAPVNSTLESAVCEIKFLSPKVRAPPIIKWYLFVVIIDFIKPAMESPLHTRTLTVCLGTPRQKHQKSIIESDDPAQKADLEWQKAQRRGRKWCGLERTSCTSSWEYLGAPLTSS